MITFPTLQRTFPTEIIFGLLSVTQVSVSPLNGATQTLELPGARWRATYTWNGLQGPDLAALQVFRVQCRGMSQRFNLPIYERQKPLGVGGGTPVVDGVGQTGVNLAIRGAPNSTTAWLRKGDYVSFASVASLHILTADANTDGTGRATLALEPPLRLATVDGDAVEINRPVVQCMLADSTQQWTTVPGGKPTATMVLDCVEAWW
jgi:hypothetical protein